MMAFTDLCRQCISDIEEIESVFDLSTSRCRDWAVARHKMADLKTRWKNLLKQYRDTEFESVLRRAFTKINVRSNSVPDGRWLSELYAARGKFINYLGKY